MSGHGDAPPLCDETLHSKRSRERYALGGEKRAKAVSSPIATIASQTRTRLPRCERRAVGLGGLSAAASALARCSGRKRAIRARPGFSISDQKR
jgi:hypothetical protein